MFWILILSRLYFISIKSNKYYEKLANQNIINREYLAPQRGEIKDNNQTLIATNKLGFSISLLAHLNNKKNALRLLEDISFVTSKLTDFNQTKLLKRYKKFDSGYNHKPVEIIDFIPYDKIILKFVELSNNKDIVLTPKSKRYYPFGNIASHVIGYVSKANKKDMENSNVAKHLGIVGKNGIEKYYDSILSGKMGTKEVKVTASNRELEVLKHVQPKSSDITITIDMKLQKYIQELYTDVNGAIIVMNIKDGSILSAGSYPEYDINQFTQGISTKDWQKMIKDLNHPFANKFVNGLYPPGSSIKPAIALSYLNSGLIDEKEKSVCSGSLSLGKRKFRCWASWGHGKVDLRRSISESCDDYFYKGGLRVGIDSISTDLTRYGFGKKTGVDLPNEFIGVVPSRNWKINKFGESWYKGETLNTVIGQGNVLTTPMQIANFTAMIASGREIMPHLIKSIDDQNITYEPKEIFNELELTKLPIIREGMYDVCNHKRGTAYKYNFSKITIAGKTGTSQVIGIPQEEKERMNENDLKYYQKSHAWFTSYGPYSDPQFVITTIIEHGGHGGDAAGELVSKVYNKLVDLNYIDKKFIKDEYKIQDINKSRTLQSPLPKILKTQQPQKSAL
jgi:penicillin-binding protein 2